MKDPLKISLVGCGKMGSALLRGWIAAGIAEKIHVLEPAGLPDEFAAQPAVVQGGPKPDTDIIVIAVKPQVMDSVCADIAPVVPRKALVLSIAAGQKIAAFEKFFGIAQPIVRAMPNTPASIGKGISVAVANKQVSAAQREQAQTVLSAAGAVEWTDNESLLDAVTAVSGSGPAYVFLLIETMAKAGEKAGLPAALAMKLARETVIGSAALAEQESATPAAKLRENVTSPGGTTAAALTVLMAENGMQDLLSRAVSAATKRGHELGKA